MDDLVNGNSGPTGGGEEVPGPHLPAGHPYWDTDWDNLHWPRPTLSQDENQDAPQAAAEAADPDALPDVENNDPFDKFTEARTVSDVYREGIHPELGPGYGDLEDTPVKVLFNGIIWLFQVELVWKANWSLKRLLQEAVRIAKADLAYEREMELVRTSGSSFSFGEAIYGWHGPHSRGMPTDEGIDFCVEEGNIWVVPQGRSWYFTALDG